MNGLSDFILQALRYDLKTGETALIESASVVDPDNDHFHYFCADCYAKGHHVRLKYVKQSERTYKFERWNLKTEEVLLNRFGEPQTKNRTYTHPAHFDRWPGAADHQCEQSVRYAAFRSTALYMNAAQIGDHSYVFPISLPAEGWNNHDEKEPVDLRSSFRPAGMGLGVIKSASDLGKLLKHFERDPGLQYLQSFHDGYKVRSFDELFFESPLSLMDYLQKEGAFSRQTSVLVAYLLNPNTSSHSVKDAPKKDALVDRSMPKLDDGHKLKLFVRSMSGGEAKKTLNETGRRHGWFNDAPLVVLGEARIADKDQAGDYRIEIEFFNPSQIMPWESPMRFLPKFSPEADGQARLAM